MSRCDSRHKALANGCTCKKASVCCLAILRSCFYPFPDKTHVLLWAQVDIPPPFSFMPKPVLTAAGNTALQGSTQIIMVCVSISKKGERTGTASHMSCM